MKSLVDTFITVLEEEAALLETLESLLQRKKRAVIEFDGDRLGDVTLEIEKMRPLFHRVDANRLEIHEKLSEALHCRPTDLNLKDLAKRLPEPYAAKVEICRKNFGNAARRVEQCSSNIRSLLSHTIQLLGTSINVLNNNLVPHYVYCGTGEAEQKSPSGRIFSRSI